jgi:hypothetical protein
MKSLFALCVVAGAWPLVQAQTAPIGGPVTGSVVGGLQVPTAIQSKQLAFNNSQAQFASHNFAAAEDMLEAANVAAKGSPQWHFESGFSLARVAFVFQSHADAVTAEAVARLALTRLKVADQTYAASTSPGEIANEKELTGYIYQFLLGDRSTAKTYYQAAVKLSPKTGNAPALLAAITASETAEAQKLAAAQGN